MQALLKGCQLLESKKKEVNVAKKLSWGKFSAAFMLQCLSAIGSTVLHLE